MHVDSVVGHRQGVQCIGLRVQQGARQAGSTDSFQPQHLRCYVRDGEALSLLTYLNIALC